MVAVIIVIAVLALLAVCGLSYAFGIQGTALALAQTNILVGQVGTLILVTVVVFLMGGIILALVWRNLRNSKEVPNHRVVIFAPTINGGGTGRNTLPVSGLSDLLEEFMSSRALPDPDRHIVRADEFSTLDAYVLRDEQ